MPNGSIEKLNLCRILIKLRPVQALIGLIQNPEYGDPRKIWWVTTLTWNLKNYTKGGYHGFFSTRTKNRFASNQPHKEEQLLLVSNLKSVWLCGCLFSISVRFNDAHFCSKKTCQMAAVKNWISVGFLSNSDQFKLLLTLFKIQNMEILG